MNKVALAFALATLLASGAAMAQAEGSEGSEGRGSQVTICRSRIERAELRAQSITDSVRQSEVNQAVKNARDAMAAGNSAKCIVELDKIGR